jgi:hypothetical protein
MTVMAKKKHKPNRSPAWIVNVRLDPDLEPMFERYAALQEFEPTIRQVVERALRELFRDAGITEESNDNDEE